MSSEPRPRVHANFLADIRVHFLEQLAAEGIDYARPLETARAERVRRWGLALDEAHWACRHWFAVQKRKIPAAPREVVWSRELRARRVPIHVSRALQDLEQKVQAGADLTPHLSKRWRELDHSDHLLNDWALHHLHLWPGGKGRELLFVALADTTMAFVDLRDHKAFEDPELLAVMQRNWPDALAQYRQAGVGRLYTIPTKTDLARARHVGMNMMPVINGVVYGQMGWGQVTSGFPLDALMRADNLFTMAGRWMRWLEAEAEAIVRDINAARGTALRELHCCLAFDDRIMTVVETEAPVRIDNLKYRF